MSVNEVAVENLDVKMFSYKNILIKLFLTKEPVEMGRQLGWCYGDDFWLVDTNIPRLFFKHNGSLISPDSYSIEKIFVSIRSEADTDLESTIGSMSQFLASSEREGFILVANKKESLIYAVSEEKFKKSLEIYRGSPYVIIDKPDETLAAYQEGAKEETIEQTQNHTLPRSNEQKASNESYGLFKYEGKEFIFLLDQLSIQYNLKGWKYDPGRRAAYLTFTNLQEMMKLNNYLENLGIRTVNSENGNTNKYELQIYHPEKSIKLLRKEATKIKECQTRRLAI